MSRYTVDQFVAATAQKDEARGTFELENPYTLEVNLNGRLSREDVIGDRAFNSANR